MNERITLVSLFNQNNLKKINDSILVLDEPLCKVPFGKNVNNRFQADTLPSHFTLSSWDIKRENFILQELSKIFFEKFNILVDKIDIMNGAENSYVLYFNIALMKILEYFMKKSIIFDLLNFTTQVIFNFISLLLSIKIFIKLFIKKRNLKKTLVLLN